MFRLQKGLKINSKLTENELTLSVSFTKVLKIAKYKENLRILKNSKSKIEIVGLGIVRIKNRK